MTDHIAIAGEQIAAGEKSIEADQAAEVIDAGDALVEPMLIFEAPGDGYIPSRYVFNRQAPPVNT